MLPRANAELTVRLVRPPAAAEEGATPRAPQSFHVAVHRPMASAQFVPAGSVGSGVASGGVASGDGRATDGDVSARGATADATDYSDTTDAAAPLVGKAASAVASVTASVGDAQPTSARRLRGIRSQRSEATATATVEELSRAVLSAAMAPPPPPPPPPPSEYEYEGVSAVASPAGSDAVSWVDAFGRLPPTERAACERGIERTAAMMHAAKSDGVTSGLPDRARTLCVEGERSLRGGKLSDAYAAAYRLLHPTESSSAPRVPPAHARC